jgi:ribokinase
MSKKKPVVVVGSINMDLVARTQRIPVQGETVSGDDFQVHPGGKGANQAVAAARLGYPVRMIGRLGDDAFGAQLRSHLESAGVDCGGIVQSQGSSGVAVIVVSDSGENVIVVIPGANALLTPRDLDANIEILGSAGMVLAQLEVPMETVEHLAHICSREGIPLMLDPAPAVPLPPDLLQNVTWLTPNETEAAFYIDHSADSPHADSPAEIARGLIAAGAQQVVLKLGSRGAFVTSGLQAGTQVPSFPVKAVDTTAAGDCFNGAFAVGLMMGKSPVESACFAAAAAAISVTRAGAQPSMPTLPEVEEMLRQKDSLPEAR